MSDWEYVYTFDNEEIIDDLQEKFDSKEYDIEYFLMGDWHVKKDTFIREHVEYRYKKKEPELPDYLDYEFFKDMPPMQIIPDDGSFIYDVTYKSNSIIACCDVPYKYEDLLKFGYKWRVFEAEYALNFNLERVVNLGWSEWRTFKREDNV